jgi:spoIIIJ-associated protein
MVRIRPEELAPPAPPAPPAGGRRLGPSPLSQREGPRGLPPLPRPAQDMDTDEEEDEETAPPRRAAIGAGDEVVTAAIDILRGMLDTLGVDAHITARAPVTPGDGVGMVTAVLDVTGEDLGMLIGRRGETLMSLQYIVNLMLQRRLHKRVMVGIDVGGYRRRREEALRALAARMADRVRQTGQSITLEPMPPAERRIVHIALANSPHVLTVSIGEGDARKVAITPRR